MQQHQIQGQPANSNMKQFDILPNTGRDQHEGNVMVSQCLAQHSSIKGCLKCMYITSLCCYVLNFIYYAYSLLAYDTVTEELSLNDEGDKHLKLILVQGAVITLLTIVCLIKLYSAVQHHNPERTDKILIVYGLFVVINLVIPFCLSGFWIEMFKPGYLLLDFIASLAWNYFVFSKTHEFSCIIKRLRDVGKYDIGKLIF